MKQKPHARTDDSRYRWIVTSSNLSAKIIPKGNRNSSEHGFAKSIPKGSEVTLLRSDSPDRVRFSWKGNLWWSFAGNFQENCRVFGRNKL
jgi:hypothetical protein